MASGGCKDAFVECVAAAVKDGSGTPTTTQPLPCLDAADSLKKCTEENAGKYAHTLDLIASGAGEGEADANNANRGLVLELMKMQEAQLKVQKAAAEMELRPRECKACKDAFDFEALEECVAGLAAGGMTTTTLPLPCLEAAASLEKCMEEQEHADEYFCMLNRFAAGAREGEADAGKVGVCNCQPQG